MTDPASGAGSAYIDLLVPVILPLFLSLLRTAPHQGPQYSVLPFYLCMTPHKGPESGDAPMFLCSRHACALSSLAHHYSHCCLALSLLSAPYLQTLLLRTLQTLSIFVLSNLSFVLLSKLSFFVLSKLSLTSFFKLSYPAVP